MSDYKPGEIVDITIRGARVLANGTDDLGRPFLEFTHGEQNVLAAVERDDHAVTIERVTPAEWPPQPGDLWRDSDGDVWFAYGLVFDGDGLKALRCANGAKVLGPWGSDDVNQQYGPLVLVHREDGAR